MLPWFRGCSTAVFALKKNTMPMCEGDPTPEPAPITNGCGRHEFM